MPDKPTVRIALIVCGTACLIVGALHGIGWLTFMGFLMVLAGY